MASYAESTSSISALSEESGDSTLDYEVSLGRLRGQGRGKRGAAGSGRGKGRGGTSGRGRRGGRSTSVRGKRKARGDRLQTEEVARLEELRNERKKKADDLIDSLDQAGVKKYLRLAADRNPSLLLDIAAEVSRGEGDPEPEPETPEWPSWCTCHHCSVMPSDRENVCCGMRPNLCCSIQPEMDLVITERLALHINMMYRNDVLALGAQGQDEAEENKGYRHAAYRAYTLHEYGRLTYQDRRVVPSCVVKYIRRKFPDPNGQYVGFLPAL